MTVRAPGDLFSRVDLGSWPTPISDANGLRKGLWIKNDGECSEFYSGNKVRKLEFILPRCNRRVVTCGAVGSHHVLATAIHGTRLGHEVQAVVFPRPYSHHARDVLRATLGRAEVICRRDRDEALRVYDELAREATPIPAGGSSVAGAMGYVQAMVELKVQISEGLLPAPRRIFVPVGTAGTFAGLVVGAGLTNLDTEIVGIRVVPHDWLSVSEIDSLCRETSRSLGVMPGRWRIDDSFLGAGYGCATTASNQAISKASSLGLDLECCYTGKAMAAALAADGGPDLFWQTSSQVSLPHSSAPPQPFDLNQWGW